MNHATNTTDHDLERVRTLNLWARHGLSADLGVPYGDAPEERLDVFHGETDGPVVVFIHGGHWTSNRAEDFSFVAFGLAAAGATVVVANHGLCPAISIGEVIGQHGAAIAWTCRHVADYGADPHRIAVVGHAAGAHGAAMLASTDWASAHGLGADVVKGYCAISGLFDLRPLVRTGRPERLGRTAESAAALSPARNPPAAAPPMLVTYGLVQANELLSQSIDFATSWRSAGLPIRTWARPGLNHDDELLALIYAGSDLTARVLALTEGRLDP